MGINDVNLCACVCDCYVLALNRCGPVELCGAAVKCERAIGRPVSNVLMVELCRECTSRQVKG